MSDLILRPDLSVAQASMRLMDSTGVSVNPYTGDTLTSSLGGDRMGCTVEFSPTGGGSSTGAQDRALLLSTLARLRGKQRRLYITDSAHRRRGGFPTSELITNSDFRSGTTGWTSSSADVILYGTDRTLRLARTSAAATDVSVYTSAITVTNGATYVARAFVTGGYGGVSLKVRVGTSAGGAEVTESSLQTTDGMITVTFVASGTTVYFSLRDYGSGGGRTTGMIQEVHYVTLARCFKVNGAGQTGENIKVSGVPTFSTDVCLAGDQAEFITSRGSQLVMLTSSMQSQVSDGWMQVAPNMRGTLADGAAVIVHQPFGRFIYSGQVPEWMTEPGMVSRASLELVEAQ